MRDRTSYIVQYFNNYGTMDGSTVSGGFCEFKLHIDWVAVAGFKLSAAACGRSAAVQKYE